MDAARPVLCVKQVMRNFPVCSSSNLIVRAVWVSLARVVDGYRLFVAICWFTWPIL